MSEQDNNIAKAIMPELCLPDFLKKVQECLNNGEELSKSWFEDLKIEAEEEYRKNYRAPKELPKKPEISYFEEFQNTCDFEKEFEKIRVRLYQLITLKACLYEVENKLEELEELEEKPDKLITETPIKKWWGIRNLWSNIRSVWNQIISKKKFKNKKRSTEENLGRVKKSENALVKESKKLIEEKSQRVKKLKSDLKTQELEIYTHIERKINSARFSELEKEMSKEGITPSKNAIKCYKKLSKGSLEWFLFWALKEPTEKEKLKSKKLIVEERSPTENEEEQVKIEEQEAVVAPVSEKKKTSETFSEDSEGSGDSNLNESATSSNKVMRLLKRVSSRGSSKGGGTKKRSTREKKDSVATSCTDGSGRSCESERRDSHDMIRNPRSSRSAIAFLSSKISRRKGTKGAPIGDSEEFVLKLAEDEILLSEYVDSEFNPDEDLAYYNYFKNRGPQKLEPANNEHNDVDSEGLNTDDSEESELGDTLADETSKDNNLDKPISTPPSDSEKETKKPEESEVSIFCFEADEDRKPKSVSDFTSITDSETVSGKPEESEVSIFCFEADEDRKPKSVSDFTSITDSETVSGKTEESEVSIFCFEFDEDRESKSVSDFTSITDSETESQVSEESPGYLDYRPSLTNGEKKKEKSKEVKGILRKHNRSFLSSGRISKKEKKYKEKSC